MQPYFLIEQRQSLFYDISQSFAKNYSVREMRS
jgi:hypothetical protein